MRCPIGVNIEINLDLVISSCFRLFQKVFSLKKSKKNEFESLMRKSKVSKNLEKQQIFTKFYMENVKRNKPILQMHLVTLLEQTNVEVGILNLVLLHEPVGYTKIYFRHHGKTWWKLT